MVGPSFISIDDDHLDLPLTGLTCKEMAVLSGYR